MNAGKGRQRGDLPAGRPPTFELAINRRTARRIGVVIRQRVLLRATALLD